MQQITIETQYENWIEQNVVPAFQGKGVEITVPARTMLAYVLQSQTVEGLVRGDAQLFELADSLLDKATEVYGEMYGTERMTINRALHIIVQTNLRYARFPWGTSD